MDQTHCAHLPHSFHYSNHLDVVGFSITDAVHEVEVDEAVDN